MKKCIFLMMAMLSIGSMPAIAQSIEFQYHGKSLNDGDTVTIAAETNAFGELSCETNPISNPGNGLILKLPKDCNGKVTARLEILHNTLNAALMQWCMGGACTMFGNKTTLEKTFDAAEGVQVLFDASSIGSTGYLMALLSAAYNSATATVHIQFANGESAGISNVLQPQAPQKVYSISGQLLLDDACGTKMLPPGVYIAGGRKIAVH